MQGQVPAGWLHGALAQVSVRRHATLSCDVGLAEGESDGQQAPVARIISGITEPEEQVGQRRCPQTSRSRGYELPTADIHPEPLAYSRRPTDVSRELTTGQKTESMCDAGGRNRPRQGGGPRGRFGYKTRKALRTGWDDRPHRTLGFYLPGVFKEGLPAIC